MVNSQAERNQIKQAFLDSGVTRLYYMAPLPNMLLIASMGILSYNEVKRLRSDPRLAQLFRSRGWQTIASPEVQRKRDGLSAFGRNLHDYVPLYMGLFTPMQYVCTKDNFDQQAERIVFADVSVEKVFDIEGVCYTDGNAAASETYFYRDAEGIGEIEWSIVLHENSCYTPDWKRWKCAEVLVPDKVPPECIDSYTFMDKETANKFCDGLRSLDEQEMLSHYDFQVFYNANRFYSMSYGKLVPNA